ncbi:response regulator [Stackebrandtia soli]|uniref:response regulator n=1 Tax=Stackebrandtia soli TaxID=1892856 RepID=UPI0039E91BBC
MNTIAPIRIALVDDQHLFRSGLTVIIDAQDDMTVVGQAADGREALDMIAATDPDVVLMDVQMSPMDGVEATRRLFHSGAPTPSRPRVIMLTTFELDPHAAQAIRYGAVGFLLKVSTPQFVCETIRTVHSGGSVLASQDLTAILDQAPPTPIPHAYAQLTERERKVFAATAEGMSNAEIAGRLFLSESTVKTHIGAILRKLELRDRVQMVVYAYEHRLRP